ncbi:unnamed protein product, partial [Tetraodon nigroviridis]
GGSNTMSEPTGTGVKPAPQGGVEMAAAMAAKINAMLMAKGKLMTPPPLLAKTPPSVPVPVITEELVVTEVDINDVPFNCRDLLTKGKTQEEIRLFSGAVVTTKGHFMTETEKEDAGQRPLYLHVQGKNQEQVNKAVMRIKEIISEDLLRASAASGGQQVPIMPPLTLYPQPPRPVVSCGCATDAQRHFGARTGTPARSSTYRRNFVHTKIFVGLDQALQSFNVKEKVEGPGGSYLSHIQTETGARVFLRGKNSGYIEQASKRESFEPLHVYIRSELNMPASCRCTQPQAPHSAMVQYPVCSRKQHSYLVQPPSGSLDGRAHRAREPPASRVEVDKVDERCVTRSSFLSAFL